MITISRTNDRVRITGTSSSVNLSDKGTLDIGLPVNQFYHHRRGDLLVIRTDSALYETKDLRQADNFRGWLEIPLTDIAGTSGSAANRYSQVLNILDFPPDPNVQTVDPIIGSGSDANRVRLQPGNNNDYLQTQGGVVDWFPLTVNVGRGLQGNGRAGSPVQFPTANDNEVLAWDAGTSTYRPEVRPLFLELTNPGAAIVAGDVGKFAMPHPSVTGAAAVYAWEPVSVVAATATISDDNFFTQYGTHPDRYEIRDDTDAVVFTATVTTDFAPGADDASRLLALAAYLTSNGYPSTVNSTDISVELDTAGAIGNSYTLKAFGDAGEGVLEYNSSNFSGGVDSFNAPLSPVLGKIVAVSSSTVTIDNVTARDYCTVGVGNVIARNIVLPADGGASIVDLTNHTLTGITPIVLGKAQEAGNQGDQVFVVFGDYS